MSAELIQSLQEKIATVPLFARQGRPEEISATRISAALDGVAIGEICQIVDPLTHYRGLARVIALHRGQAILAPLDLIEGLSAEARILPTGEEFRFACGPHLLGRLLDGLGRPLDGKPLDGRADAPRRSIGFSRINPMDRPPIDQIFPSGIVGIDALNTLGSGQRVGLFGDPGTGKSNLLGALARNNGAELCVLALIGERGREIREFLDRQLPKSFRERCVVVASSADTPAMQRIMGAYLATAIAEYFRGEGRQVLLLFDSITRFARAVREVGLAAGEQAVRRGFTPSVYAQLPLLVERCGRIGAGSITAIYTVLTENDGLDDPIAEEVRSLTDGHIVLSPLLAQAGRYPAIDHLKSRSRLMHEIVDAPHRQAASRLRQLMSKYQEVELLVQVGEYQHGSDALADEAIAKREAIADFLHPKSNEKVEFASMEARLQALARADETNEDLPEPPHDDAAQEN